jgi:hypothetical protein
MSPVATQSAWLYSLGYISPIGYRLQMPEDETADRGHMLFTCEPDFQPALRLSLRSNDQLDPNATKQLTYLAAYYFEAGPKEYVEWSNRMVAELGEPVKPHLRKAFINIPRTMSSRAGELNSDPLTTQAQRVAVGCRYADLTGVWQDSYRNLVLSEEDDVFPHPHFCPVCTHEWTCKDSDCMLPNEYWCESHAGTKPLPERLDADTHGHYCPNCCRYWEHRYRECLLPEVYECDDHGGISDEEFLRAASLLLAVSSRWPYGSYVLLHLVVCAVSLYWASEAFKQSQIFWVWALGTNAFLFSPIFPMRIGRSDWEIIDVVAAAFLVVWLSFSAYRDWRIKARKPE